MVKKIQSCTYKRHLSFFCFIKSGGLFWRVPCIITRGWNQKSKNIYMTGHLEDQVKKYGPRDRPFGFLLDCQIGILKKEKIIITEVVKSNRPFNADSWLVKRERIFEEWEIAERNVTVTCSNRTQLNKLPDPHTVRQITSRQRDQSENIGIFPMSEILDYFYLQDIQAPKGQLAWCLNPW